MARPFVSVLIDTYNHERFIEEAIVSALEQDFPAADREIIVVDDGSTDHTPEIVRKFGPHVRLLRKENGGQASAFNTGIAECKGEIVAFLDGDDWWEHAKLSAVVRAFNEHPEIGTIGHGFCEVNERDRQRTSITPRRMCRNFLRTSEEAAEFFALLCFLGTSRVAIRARILEKILPVSNTLLADLFMASVATAVSGAMILDWPLTNYRLHETNVYQFSGLDDVRMRKKLEGVQSLAKALPATLRKWNVSDDVIRVLMHPFWLEAEQLRLGLGEGWPWETVRVEHAAFQHAHRSPTKAYQLFHALVLTVALLTPPRIFYRLRHWYSAKRLSRVRERFASVTPAQALAVRKLDESRSSALEK